MNTHISAIFKARDNQYHMKVAVFLILKKQIEGYLTVSVRLVLLQQVALPALVAQFSVFVRFSATRASGTGSVYEG